MSEKSMTGEALESALGAGTLDEGGGSGGPRSFEALVRTSDKEGHVGVAVAGCGSFVDVPTELIAAAEKIGYVACGGHGHPQMRITLAESDDPMTEVLHQLLGSMTGRGGPTGLPHNHAPNFGAGRPMPMGGPDMGPTGPFTDPGPPGGPMEVAHQIDMGMPVCRWQAYPCGFTRDPFRIVWCYVRVCRFGGYDGYDMIVK